MSLEIKFKYIAVEMEKICRKKKCAVVISIRNVLKKSTGI